MFSAVVITFLWSVAAFSAPEGPRAKATIDDAPGSYRAARRVVLDRGANPGLRSNELRDLVLHNAVDATEVLASVLDDPDKNVRRQAAEWLAVLGDKRGLDIQAECVTTLKCDRPHNAARLLGNSRRPEYAEMLRGHVDRLLLKGRRADRTWLLTAEDRALLECAARALAQIGEAGDADVLVDVVEAQPAGDWLFLDILGYVNSPRSRQVLRSRQEYLRRKGFTFDVPALIELTRLGDGEATRQYRDLLEGVGLQQAPAKSGSFPSCQQGDAFRVLRHRDSANLAETVLSVAARQPEGSCTREAWRALGVMHPPGFGDRVLRLAVSKKPHWDYVSRELLNNVVISVSPDLNEAFWAEFDVEAVPVMSGPKTLVRKGLGYLLFSGTGDWTGD